MNRLFRLLPLLCLLALLAPPAYANVPPVVATEGVLSSTGGVPLANGLYALTFRLYAAQSGGVAVWQESASVTVSGGRFAWELGSLTPLSAAIAAQGQWIGVQVGNEPELPRAPWRSSPFALRAQVAEGLECTGCIKSPMLDPGLLAGYALLSDLTAYVKTVDLNTLLALYVKASDLAAYAKLTDLSGLAKIADLADYVKLADLAAYAKTADLSVFAKTVDVATQLAAYAKTSDLAAYAKLTDLGAYAKTSDLAVYEKSADLTTTLAGYAKLTDLAGLAKTTDLALYAKLTDLGAYAKTSDLAAYALKTDLAAYETTAALTTALANYALKTDLSGYAKTVDVVATLTAYAKTADLAAYAKAADLAIVAFSGNYSDLSGGPDLSVFALTANLAKVATTGSYTDLAGKPTLAQVGTACAVGQVVTGIAADGALVCGAGGGGASTLSGISNGLLDNIFDLTYASTTTPLTIPDNNPVGISSEIDVPDVGIVKSITVSVNVTTQDLSGLSLFLYDPAGNSYVLYNKGTTGSSLTATYPAPNATVSGDLSGTWVGQNATGAWFLVAKDSKAGGTVGTLANWSVNLKVLSSQKVAATGSLAVNGTLTVGGKAVPQVWTAENLALAPGASLSIDTGLGDVPLAVSAWVKVGSEWKLVTPNVPETACPACGGGEDGDFSPTTNTSLAGGRWYKFRSVSIPPGVTVSATGGPLLIASANGVSIDGTLSVVGQPGGVAACGDTTPKPGPSGGPGGFDGESPVYQSGQYSAGIAQGPGGGVGGNASLLIGGGGGGFVTTGGAGTNVQVSVGGVRGAGGASYPPSAAIGGFVGGSGGGAVGYPVYGDTAHCSSGGGGGGALAVVARTISVTGSILASGGAGGVNGLAGSGGGSGGFIWLRATSVGITGLVQAPGGLGGHGSSANGGDGSAGRINIDAYSIAGSTTPAYAAGTTVGLAGDDAAGFSTKLSGGVATIANSGIGARSVRLVVVR